MDPYVELSVDRDAGPLHVAIAEQLGAAIASGRLAVGERLPPERRLAESLGVSRMTVRQALGELERAGLVRRVVGRTGGTFVRDPAEGHVTEAIALSASLRHEGRVSGIEIVSATVEPARRRTASALGLARNEPVVVIVRLLLAKGKPLAVERTSLPSRLFPDIEDLDLSGRLSELMGGGFGLAPVRSIESVEASEARRSDARILGVRRGSPMLIVERLAYSADGTAVSFGRDRFRGDRTRIVGSGASAV